MEDDGNKQFVEDLAKFLSIDERRRSLFVLPSRGKRYCFPNRFNIGTFSSERLKLYIINQLAKPNKAIYNSLVKNSVRAWLSFVDMFGALQRMLAYWENAILATFPVLLETLASGSSTSLARKIWLQTLREIPKPYRSSTFSFWELISKLHNSNVYWVIRKRLEQLGLFLATCTLQLVLQDFMKEMGRRVSQTLLRLDLLTYNFTDNGYLVFVGPYPWSSSQTPFHIKPVHLYTNKVTLYYQSKTKHVGPAILEFHKKGLFGKRIPNETPLFCIAEVDDYFHHELRRCNLVALLLQTFRIYDNLQNIVFQYGFPAYGVTTNNFILQNRFIGLNLFEFSPI